MKSLSSDCDQKLTNNMLGSVKRIEQQLKQQLLPLKQHQCVNDVRVLGAIGVVETVKCVDIAKVQKLFVELGVWIRPFWQLIYIMPPYIIHNEALTQLMQVIEHVLDKDIYQK